MTPRRHALKKALSNVLATAAVAAAIFGLPRPAAAEDELVFAGFGGSLQKALQATVIPAFEKKYGVRVIYVTGTSNQILAKVKTQRSRPQIDVIWANDTTHYQGKADGLFAKLDPAKVPNLENLYDFAKDPDGVGVVMGIQALGIEYNTDVFKEKGWEPPTSWADLWDEKYKGHVVAYNMPIGYTNLLLGKIAAMNGGSSEQLDAAWDKFKALTPNASPSSTRRPRSTPCSAPAAPGSASTAARASTISPTRARRSRWSCPRKAASSTRSNSTWWKARRIRTSRTSSSTSR